MESEKDTQFLNQDETLESTPTTIGPDVSRLRTALDLLDESSNK